MHTFVDITKRYCTIGGKNKKIWQEASTTCSRRTSTQPAASKDAGRREAGAKAAQAITPFAASFYSSRG